MKTLSSEDALRLLDNDPDNLWIPLKQLMREWKLTPGELLKELQSGRLIASAACKNPTFDEIVVSATHAIDWMAHRHDPTTSCIKN
jgi:hypothetical protein